MRACQRLQFLAGSGPTGFPQVRRKGSFASPLRTTGRPRQGTRPPAADLKTETAPLWLEFSVFCQKPLNHGDRKPEIIFCSLYQIHNPLHVGASRSTAHSRQT